MRVKLSLAVLSSLVLCCLCLASARAQSGKTVPPPTPLPFVPPPPVPPQTARLVEDTAAPVGWKRYEFKYGEGDTMSVFFPKAPTESVEKTEVTNGAYSIVHILSAETPAGVYLAGYLELIAPSNIKITPAAKEIIFNGFWKNFSSGMQQQLEKMGIQAKLTSAEPRKVVAAGREAQEQDFNVGNVTGRYRVVAGERTLYMMVTLGFGEGSAKERDIFVESLRLAAAR
ncbi:MAG: hypothetical protein LC785_00385 [Acidobacteria bacterium]|nr:hypothetical protein [Acidobacteriota bacterium]MCA1640449.1 hypothetical protein [Acidobacteriota bacterium]